jgi:SpoVK/Ycf46/Vps4 family AAA+-type ATPase
MPTNAERLTRTLRGGASCIWIPTLDEAYALELVRNAASDLGLPLRQWSVVRGLEDGLIAGSPPQNGTEHPAAALVAITNWQDRGMCVMLDLIGHLDDERTMRALREAIEAIDRRDNRLILIDHRDAAPAVVAANAERFDILLPSDEEIEAIVRRTLRASQAVGEVEIEIRRKAYRAIVRNLRGLTRSQVERVMRSCVGDDGRFDERDLERVISLKQDLLRSEGLLEFVDAPVSMDEIGGLATLKRWLSIRAASMDSKAADAGLSPPRGVLLLGVQGAGKSLSAKAVATAWRRPLLRLDPGVLYDRYIGESERRLRQALEQAEMMAPVVLWIDEIEKAFAGAASHSVDGGLSRRMFGSLLTWMQEHRQPVFIVATANDIEALPPELMRKGRFDEIFFVDLPDRGTRALIVSIHLRKRGRDPSKFDLDALAEAAHGFSGAEIEQAIVSALLEAHAAGKELDTGTIRRVMAASPPLSVTMAERVAELRSWAVGRCVSAD